MKTLAYYLLGIFSLCLLNACSDEENPTPEPPPSKGQEEVQKIVEVLKESNPEVSQFVEILEKVNVADLTQDELTVFAVKNKNTASRAAVLDTASIKNHIVKGRYAKEDLTYIIHSGFISGYQNRYGDNLKPPTNVYHRMTA